MIFKKWRLNFATLCIGLIGLTVLSPIAQGQQSGGQKSDRERLEELELRSTLNVFSFRGGMTNTFDSITDTPNNALTGDPVTASKNEWYRSDFWLDFTADSYDDLKFYGRLGSSFFWNTLRRNGDGGEGLNSDGDARSFVGSRSYWEPSIWLDKAYFDYLVTEDFILSLGRLPTFDGPPSNILDKRGREGTYPRLLYNAMLDGLAATYRFKFGNDQNLSVRYVYTPMMNPGFGGGGVLGSSGTTTIGNGAAGLGPFALTLRTNSNSPIHAGMLDYRLENLNFAKDLEIQFAYLKIGDLYWQTTIKTPIATGAPTYGEFTTPSNLRTDHNIFTGHFALNDIAGLGLHLTFSSISHEINSRGAVVDPSGAFGGAVGQHYAYLKQVDGSDDTASISGTASLINLAYDLPLRNSPRLGLEYWTASENFENYDLARTDLTSFYWTPGTAYHVYLTVPVKDTFTVRGGFRVQEFAHEAFNGQRYIFNRAESNREVNTFYLLTKLDF